MITVKPELADVVDDPALLLALDLEPLAQLLDEAKRSAAEGLNAARAVQDEVLSRYGDAIDRAFRRARIELGAVSVRSVCGRFELLVERFRRPDGSLGSQVRARRDPHSVCA